MRNARQLRSQLHLVRPYTGKPTEADRWHPASEALPSAETLEVTLYVVGVPTRSEGRKTGPNNWETPHGSRSDAGILGWRRLGPGPEAA